MAALGRRLAFSLAAAASLVGLADALPTPPRFIFASSPTTHNVVWASLPTFQELTKPASQRTVQDAQVLIDGQATKCTGAFCSETSDQGLKTPQGLAVHVSSATTATLYVSDVEAQNIYAYSLSVTAPVSPMGVHTPSASNQLKVRETVTAQWLTVDGYGNLFYTTTDGNVEMLSAENMTASAALGARATPVVLYSSASSQSVAGPAGIAADNFFLYWANQQGDSASGTVARGPERQSAQNVTPSAVTQMTDQYQAVAANLCLARDNVFFTGETSSLFAVKTTGGAIAEVNQNFSKPIGCVYDEESTLYVADEQANAVFSLPANFVNLRTVSQVTKFVNVNAPSQVALFSTWSQLYQA